MRLPGRSLIAGPSWSQLKLSWGSEIGGEIAALLVDRARLLIANLHRRAGPPQNVREAHFLNGDVVDPDLAGLSVRNADAKLHMVRVPTVETPDHFVPVAGLRQRRFHVGKIAAVGRDRKQMNRHARPRAFRLHPSPQAIATIRMHLIGCAT